MCVSGGPARHPPHISPQPGRGRALTLSEVDLVIAEAVAAKAAEDERRRRADSARGALVRRERGTEARDPETLKRQGSLSLSPIDDLE